MTGHATVTSVPAGISCPHECAARFPVGTPIILKTHGARGWHMVGWSGNCGGAADCRLVLNTPLTLSVSLAPDTALLGSSLRSFIRGRTGRVSVAVFDFRSGTTYVYAPANHYDAASTVKVQILGTALYQAQQRHIPLTTYEQSKAAPMIEDSDNDAANDLWEDVGAEFGVQRFDDRVPMRDTEVSPAWGLTQVTAPDAVRLERLYAVPNPVLDNRSRAFALHLMEQVTPSQRWGITGGVPAHVTVAVKDGWLPTASTAWTVNSMGWVDGDGRDYAIAVLTDENASEGYGITTIEGISARVWARLRN